VNAGQATITATVEGKTSTATITVRGAPETVAVAAIGIEPETSATTVGRNLTLVAKLRDARGAALTGRPVTWSTSDSSVLSVAANGQVTGRSPGTAVVTASVEGRSQRATITVTAPPVAAVTVSSLSGPLKPGGTAQLVVTARDADGQGLANRKAIWATSDAKVATVLDGLVTAHESGTATITATIEGRQGTVVVTVVSPVAAPTPDPSTDLARATADITRQLDAFVEALNSRDLARLKSAYPGMPAKFEEGWRNLMEQPRLNKLQATREPLPSPKLEQGVAEVPFTVNLKPDYSGQTAKPFSIRYTAVFENDSGKWQLRRLDPKQ
jgi:uncharacterized protein YjdB